MVALMLHLTAQRIGLLRTLTLTLALSFSTGCASASRDRAWLQRAVVAHTGHSLAPRESGSGDSNAQDSLPPGCTLSDGLDPNEAVAVALWRSPSLHAELTALETALADFDEARRIANPRLSLLAPIDPRQLAAILALPIEALWQAPARATAANRELERVAESLVQIVLNVVRDVKIAHADALFAQARATLMQQRVELWQTSFSLTQTRASHGENAPGEIAPLGAELAIAQDLSQRAQHELAMANARLLGLLGTDWTDLPPLVTGPEVGVGRASPEQLVARALRNRPDLRAAQLAIHATAARARWERSRVFSLIATVDGQAPVGSLSPNFSVGLQFELPLFAQNQGGIGRAEASVARAGFQYAATRVLVRAEVLTAYHSLERAQRSRVAYHTVLDAHTEAVTAAQHAFDDGAESYFFVVDALRRQQDTQLRQLELDADVARSVAELSRAVGGLETEVRS